MLVEKFFVAKGANSHFTSRIFFMAFYAIPKPRALLQAKIFENDKPSWVFVCVLVV